jgi:amidase
MANNTREDNFGAFCTVNPVSLPPTGNGPLDNLTAAVKDVMDIAGTTTGFGQPTWLATHQPATTNAAVVDKLLSGGATIVGRTISDELSYSLSGENAHYGTPVNPADASRVAGGSSSGSVVAVAAGLADLAIGTDCAGSVRLPASYCGILGMRPTHGAVSAQGVIPFAPSFDTVGWFARSASTLQMTGRTILDVPDTGQSPDRLLIANDCFDLVEPEISEALQPAIETVSKVITNTDSITVAPDTSGLDPFMECFRTIQGYEIWQNLGDWIEQHNPDLGPGIAERAAFAKTVTAEQAENARHYRHSVQQHLDRLIKPGDVLCLPTSPRVAPLKGTATDTMEVTYRYQAICLLSIAGLGGLPEVTLPLGTCNGLPVGLSLVGARGTDHMLMKLAQQIMD